MSSRTLLPEKHRRRLVVGAVGAAALALLWGGGPLAWGDSERLVKNSSELSGGALSGVKGVSTTNMAAGDGNLQSSSGTLAIGDSALSSDTLIQSAKIKRDSTIHREADISISDHAFRQAEGWLSINQAAGHGNVQSNSFGVALGISVSSLSNATLQQVTADQQGSSGTGGDAGSAVRNIEVDQTSFEGARGVIQVNQSAGMGNATSNSFRMNMALGE